MIDWKARAAELLEEYSLCCKARPHANAVDIQLDKDSCGKWAVHLNNQLGWGSDLEIAEACNQLEPRLKRLKEKVIIDILNG